MDQNTDIRHEKKTNCIEEIKMIRTSMIIRYKNHLALGSPFE